jgi:hypothetical protein
MHKKEPGDILCVHRNTTACVSSELEWSEWCFSSKKNHERRSARFVSGGEQILVDEIPDERTLFRKRE